MGEGFNASKMMSLLLLSVAVVSVTAAAPASSAAAAAKRKLSVRSTYKKTVDLDLIRRLIQQKMERNHSPSRRASGARDHSSFEDEDPLHHILSGAAAPIQNRRSENLRRNLNKDKRTNSVNGEHRVVSRFMEAIGLSPYPMDSPSSHNNIFNDHSSYGGGGSRYDDDDDDNNDDVEYYYYYDEEDDEK